MDDKNGYIRYPVYRNADDTDAIDENGYLLRNFFATEARKHGFE
jgi:hypothetical protein